MIQNALLNFSKLKKKQQIDDVKTTVHLENKHG